MQALFLSFATRLSIDNFVSPNLTFRRQSHWLIAIGLQDVVRTGRWKVCTNPSFIISLACVVHLRVTTIASLSSALPLYHLLPENLAPMVFHLLWLTARWSPTL
ncbi:hypothetical protein RJT34_06128 [Clitoria ternatea]|uniref:Uncharacterized protein n=1 Tax=Clitoria ternatea TaxID=43366 RepID=A0AAN9K3Z1_CLITE